VRIIRLLTLTIVLGLGSRLALFAQEPGETASEAFWAALQKGKLSGEARYRFETFEREGAPFTGDSYAPTLRLALGYETPSLEGFSAFAQGAAVIVTGPADYSVPTLPSMNRPDRPAILEPKGVQLSQGYLKWLRKLEGRKVAFTVGRQEIMLNDGRFVSTSSWRQIHETFDAARFDADLARHTTFTYIFINRYYRVVGHDATDGKPPMHSHLFNLAWQKPRQVNVSLYGLLLDYRSAAQYALSTQTFGLRTAGPLQINPDWSVLYTAEFANQRNFGTNPNHIKANYYLGELGPSWRGFGVKGGYALLGGRSLTDEVTTPLANPFNGWTELFGTTPNVGNSHGLEARYLTASGAVKPLGGAMATITYYDYHSDSDRTHYGSELDWALAYKVRRVSNRWEIGSRFGRYWSDRLYSRALRVSGYTDITF
jgi:hypothetical protein